MRVCHTQQKENAMIQSPTVLPNGELAVPPKNRKPRGKFLSSDELMILRNTADSLKSFDNREFLYSLVEKEFITEDEKTTMNQILNQAAIQISNHTNPGA